MKDTETLSNHGIDSDASLTLTGYSVLTLTVQLPDGKTHSITVTSYDRVPTLKPLSSYDIHSGDTLTLSFSDDDAKDPEPDIEEEEETED